MADYPTLSQSVNSKIIVSNESGIDVNYSENGIIRAIASNPETLYTATIEHKYLNEADRGIILNHYQSNKNNAFYLVFDADGYYYRLAYTSKPKITREGKVWTITSSMEGIKVGLSINTVTYLGETVTSNGEDVTYGGT